MGSLIEELKRREAAAREEVTRVLPEPAAEPSASSNTGNRKPTKINLHT